MQSSSSSSARSVLSCPATGLSWVADPTHRQGPFTFLTCILALVGLYMIGFLDVPIHRHVGVFFADTGTDSLIVAGLAWCQNNIGDSKRSVTTLIQITMAGVGSAYSAFIFRQQVWLSY